MENVQSINANTQTELYTTQAANAEGTKPLKADDAKALDSFLTISKEASANAAATLKKSDNPMQALMAFFELLTNLIENLMSFFKTQETPQEKPKTPVDTSPAPTTPKPPSTPSTPTVPEAPKPTDSKPEVNDKDIPPTTRSVLDLEVGTDDKGIISIVTDDGYTVRCEGKDQAWNITSPEGKTTRIWGDPHVDESDGDKWMFKERSTFRFGQNKITVDTVPAGNGETLTSSFSIYNGDERVTITGIDKDKPVITTVADDAKIHDAQLSDGTVYELTKEKNGDDEWKKVK